MLKLSTTLQISESGRHVVKTVRANRPTFMLLMVNNAVQKMRTHGSPTHYLNIN